MMTWKKIVGFPMYQVSSTGLVKGPKGLCGNLPLGKGYRRVVLCSDGKKIYRLIHRLVLEAFVGACPKGKVCRHLDGNPANNRVENLCWGTPKENEVDKIKHGRTNRGERNGQARLTAAVVLKIREAAKSASIASVAAQFKITYSNAWQIIRRVKWRHI